MTPTRPSAPTLLAPPDLGLARLRINGFAALKPSEQLQAAALALHRDLSVEPTNLQLAAQPAPDSGDVALVAFYARPVGASATIATRLLAAMQPGKAYWVDAPSGYIVSERGAAAVDFPGSQDQLPSVVTATLSAMGTSATVQCVLVNRDRSLISDERVAWWVAASGVVMLDGTLPTTTPVLLRPPPRARLSPRRTRFDRALQASAVAGIICLALAAVQYATLPAVTASPTTGSKGGHATPGALLDRIGTIAPDLVTQTQSATYASGAWVLALPDAVEPETLRRAERAMQANGLTVQSTSAPGPRIRVQLP